MSRVVSCGIIVTDGRCLLVGHASRSPRWDISKGVAEAGESDETAARRELLEETGLTAPHALLTLGRYAYLPRKDLALFAWIVDAMPDPVSLVCHSTFLSAGKAVPEFDRFCCPPWAEALPMLGRSMRAVLTTLAAQRAWLASEGSAAPV